MPVRAYISLGSNIGDREANLRRAVELLGEAVTVTAVSSFYVTEPVGYEQQADFLNAVVEVGTSLTAEELHSLCRSIEDRMGRERAIRWGPRTIDLDILLFGNAVVHTSSLEIPHPRMAVRKFVLAPLVEIAPEAMHPKLQKTAVELLGDLANEHRVVKYRAGGSKA